MVKKGYRAKTAWEPLGGDDGALSYPGSGEGEIEHPEAIEELLAPLEGVTYGDRSEEILRLLEALGEVTLPPPLVKSVWPPDEVRKRRKIKQRMQYLEQKAKKPKKKKKMRYWQRIKRKRDQDWDRYWNEIIPDDWKYYKSIWTRKGKTVLVEKQDWLDFLAALGGRAMVGEVWSYEGVVSFDTIIVYSPEKQELYRGTGVPDWYSRTKTTKG